MGDIVNFDLLPFLTSFMISIGSLSVISFMIITLLKRNNHLHLYNELDIGVMDTSSEEADNSETENQNNTEESNKSTKAIIREMIQNHLLEENGSLAIPIRLIVVAMVFTILLYIVPTVHSSPIKAGYVLHCGLECNYSSSSCCYVLKDHKTSGRSSLKKVAATTSSSTIELPVNKTSNGGNHFPQMKESDSFEHQNKSISGKQEDELQGNTADKEITACNSEISCCFDCDNSKSSQMEKPGNLHYWFDIPKTISQSVEGIRAFLFSYRIIWVIAFTTFFFSVFIVIASRNNIFVYSALPDESH